MTARKGTTNDFWYMDCTCGFYCINTKGNQGRGQLKRFNMHKQRCTYVGPNKAPSIEAVNKEIMNVKGGAIKFDYSITQTTENNKMVKGKITLSQMAEGVYTENTQVFQGENHSNKIKTTRKQRRIQARAEKKRKKKELRNKRKREKATKLVEKEDESDDEMTMLNFILKLSELDEVNVFVM